jgi:hypothetical protein
MTKGNGEVTKSDTELVAKEVAMRSNQPRQAVPPTPNRIAMGADLAAREVSSET